MASTDAPEPADTERGTRSTRNPRRRAHPDSDSIKIAPRRKRSKITDTTFLPREETPVGEHDVDEMNGRPPQSQSRSVSIRKTSGMPANSALDMPLRSRSGPRRISRNDSSTVMTLTDNYAVKLLPNTPRELKKQDAQFRGSIDHQSNLALAITREKVHIWDYSGHQSITSTKTVDVPSELSPHTALPFGALIAGGRGSDTGLVLVASQSGKVVYFESVDQVTSQSFFSERKEGVTSNIHGLFTGEHITQLMSAQPAGFVLVLNSGRLVQLTLRDAQGRPKVQSQILYTTEQSGGIFSSIKSILGTQSWKQAVNAVQTRTLERGQVQVLALLERGELRLWNIDWSSHYEYRSSFDFRHQLQEELRQMQPPETRSYADQLAVLDLALTERVSHIGSRELSSVSSSRPINATVLVQCGPAQHQILYLAQLSLSADHIDIIRILTVGNTTIKPSTFRPQLLIPAPYNTAFIVQQTSVTIMSLVLSASDPEAQLHEASYIEPEPYQETIFIKRQLHICGMEGETSRTNDVSAVLFIQGTGAIRVTATAQPQEAQPWERIKSRLEQAVFYGKQEGNALDLLENGNSSFAPQDVDRAAQVVSNEIFESTSCFLDLPPVSVESSLQRRASALHVLAEVLQKAYPPLPQSTRWRLLVQAEKTTAAIKLWSLYERSVTESKTRRAGSLWQEIMRCIVDKHCFQSIYDSDSIADLTRTFFVMQLDHVSDVLEFACRVMVSVAAKDNNTTPEKAVRTTSDANDIWLGCLETVFDFRTNNAGRYGILPVKLDGGIVVQPSDLQGVEELWTSSQNMLGHITKMTDEACQITVEAYEADLEPPVEQLALKVATENSRLVELSCLAFQERIAWCLSRGTEKYDDQAYKLQRAYKSHRHNQIRALSQLGQTEAGLRLAEKYKDMDTLTEALIAESQYLAESRMGAPLAQREFIDYELEKNNNRVSKCFELYGNEFSEAFFGHAIASGTTGQMLSQDRMTWNEQLTKYLREKPSRGKICWINDVMRQKDFQHSGEVLLDVANTQEQNVWSKTVQLSLAKLSMYAADENEDAPSQQVTDAHPEINKELAFMEVQDRLYAHIHPATYHSLDAEAAVKDAMSAFATGISYLPQHRDLLSDLIAKVLSHKVLTLEELIDLLTFTDATAPTREDKDLDRSETFEALTALYASPIPSPSESDLMLKLIWKRAFLQENWEKLNTIALDEGDAAVREHVSQTNIYRAVYHVLSQQCTSEADRFQILRPEETLGAGVTMGDMPSYIPEDVIELYLDENQKMEVEFEGLINEQRLTSWLPDVIRFAQDDVEAAAAEEDDYSGWAAKDPSQINGHGVNGHTNGIKEEAHDDDDYANGSIEAIGMS